jgi:F0F1-type ATP synthase assembly protein I
MNRKPERNRTLRQVSVVGMLSTIGLTMVFSIAIAIGIGLLLDRWLHKPWIIMVCALLGIVAGFQQMIRTVMQANAEEEKLEREETAERRSANETSTPPNEPNKPEEPEKGVRRRFPDPPA